MQHTTWEAKKKSKVTFFYGPLHMNVPVLADQQKPIYVNFVRTLGVVWKTCWERWMIGTDGESQGNPCCQRDLMMMMTTWIKDYILRFGVEFLLAFSCLQVRCHKNGKGCLIIIWNLQNFTNINRLIKTQFQILVYHLYIKSAAEIHSPFLSNLFFFFLSRLFHPFSFSFHSFFLLFSIYFFFPSFFLFPSFLLFSFILFTFISLSFFLSFFTFFLSFFFPFFSHLFLFLFSLLSFFSFSYFLSLIRFSFLHIFSFISFNFLSI